MKNTIQRTISGRSVILLLSGVVIGFMIGIVVPTAIFAASERVATFEEVAAATAVQEAGEAAEKAGVASPDFGIDYETAVGSVKYDGPAFADSMVIETKESWMAWIGAQRSEDPKFLEQRWNLARDLIESGELKRPEDVRAFLLTPREKFVRERNKGYEYADSWLPIGYGATITDPDVVAMMTSTLAISPGDKVLEIGTGSGYQSAILSFLTKEVYSIEIIKPLFVETNQLFKDLSPIYPSYSDINRKLGDGYYGWAKYAPFDKIIVTCAIDHIPPPLLKQLSPNGIMVLPLGPPGRQYIMEVKKRTDADGISTLTRRDVYNGLRVSFIPFRDEGGSSYSTSGPEGDLLPADPAPITP